ncbi:hypothetical protein HDK77DRAFT_61669 [Phyllosticta capitalensis]
MPSGATVLRCYGAAISASVTITSAAWKLRDAWVCRLLFRALTGASLRVVFGRDGSWSRTGLAVRTNAPASAISDAAVAGWGCAIEPDFKSIRVSGPGARSIWTQPGCCIRRRAASGNVLCIQCERKNYVKFVLWTVTDAESRSRGDSSSSCSLSRADRPRG